MADSPVALTVEFLADGRCVVDVHDAGQTSASEPRRESRADSVAAVGADFRCPVPFAAVGRRAVDLRVILPPGVDPRELDTFPRLTAVRTDDQWIGTALLPSAPAFVSVHGPNASPWRDGSFGWNFYGFFVFAAAFIAIYFGWVRWMSGRDARSTAGA